jgi:hypothetical protein
MTRLKSASLLCSEALADVMPITGLLGGLAADKIFLTEKSLSVSLSVSKNERFVIELNPGKDGMDKCISF